ncbi:MAG: hypothetical protein ACK5LL_04925 [Suipraeoptans sp.]
MIKTYDEAMRFLTKEKIKFYNEAQKNLPTKIWQGIEKEAIKEAKEFEKKEQQAEKNALKFTKYFMEKFNENDFEKMKKIVDDLAETNTQKVGDFTFKMEE